ncbi:uncharacterized protein I303_101337 [Kwoniella dejecticola CBS 10117]|uniref:Uncharacterized protein n=1 Tax=Kwoniella dejecticola CBS 10117 TaxID=1296121 RepID=A0AAJ8MEZ2_9TREE
MSDPFDEDDGFFDNPETLGMLDAVEERAIQASQQAAPKNRFTQPIRHVLAKPRNSPTSSAASSTSRLKKEPRPVNTEPGIRGTGFGWEIGGKRSFDVERHIDNAKKREAYWNAGREEEDESPPVDVVMDGSGRYEVRNNVIRDRVGSNGSVSTEEAIITDKRREQPSMLGESLGLAGPGPGTTASQQQRMVRQQSQDAIAARRKAMQAAAASSGLSAEPQPFVKPPLSRSNSNSSTGSGFLTSHITNNDQVRPPGQNRFANQGQLPNFVNEPKFNNNRSLSRSVSAGAQIFHRNAQSNAIAGPSRLPTIPSESQSQNGSNEANGSVSEGREYSAPPLSQGSAARAAAIELETERRKRQELEAELTALRAQAQAKPNRFASNAGEYEDIRKKVKELQSQVWAAKGEAEIVRRAQREEHQRHLAELERLKSTIENKDQELKARGDQAKRQVENIKHQAVFSNHAAHNSAMKNRQQSQRFPASQSQVRGFPTPVKNGSPSRRRGVADEVFTPLVQSAKGKGQAPVTGPTFGGFINAFAATPTIAPRVKRQKTAEKSSPPASPSRAVSPSPFRVSPAPARSQKTPGSVGEPGEGVDWGDEILPLGDAENAILDEPDQILDHDKDERAEFLYHLLNHVSLSTFQHALGSTKEPTLYRLMNYRPALTTPGHEIYTSRCSDILKACGDPNVGFDDLEEIMVHSLCDMLDYVVRIVLDVDQISLNEVAVFCNIITLLSSSTLLFPSMMRILVPTNTAENLRSVVHTIFADVSKVDAFKIRMRRPESDDGSHETNEAAQDTLKEKEEERDSWHVELADRIAGMAEVICFVSDSSSWKGDELVDIILGLSSIHLEPFIVKRGIELFYVASQHICNFRSLVMSSDRYKIPASPNESPLIERLSRYLINPLSSASESEALHMSLLTIRGLCMLSISHQDAIIIMGAKSILVPALIIVVQRESSKLYGIHGVLQDYKAALSLLSPTLSLLHQLVFPAPVLTSNQTQSQSHIHAQAEAGVRNQEELLLDVESVPEDALPVGIDLPERINHAASTREFNGLQHLFVSAFGVMAYSQIDEEVVSEVDQRGIQYLSGDLLENVVEGPEGDAIYELYVPLDEEEGEGGQMAQNEDDGAENNAGDDADQQNNADVDMEVYQEMERGFNENDNEVIEISDDDD